jgi:adenosylcobyric acid synthase
LSLIIKSGKNSQTTAKIPFPTRKGTIPTGIRTIAVRKRIKAVRKITKPIGKRTKRIRKIIFPIRKGTIPIGIRIFLTGKRTKAVGKGIFPVRKATKPIGKGIFPIQIRKMVNKLSPLMFVGTGSDVGKSVINAAFCRIFKQDGYSPAPFKAQNMALNSFATPEGLEIGRAQAVQAEAAGIPCHTDMNPLLLKPSADTSCQVVLNGKSIGNQHAIDYFTSNNKAVLRKEVNAAFDRLNARFNPIVLEGAGSISEINLREVDLVNMSMAAHANAAVILVADIDRGGVFASVYGSILLLNEEERKLVKGVLINKFRGDIRLFESGVKMLEELCGIPVVGVVPYYKDIHIEEEDSVMLHTKNRAAQSGKVNVAVILLQHISNFTDFNALEHDERVHLYYSNQPNDISEADIIIIPGTKNTLHDLQILRRDGIAQTIVQAHASGKTVHGICGGYQMLGRELHDPKQIESDLLQIPGLNLLPISTTLEGEKITRQVNFKFDGSEVICKGYEIHNGRTEVLEEIQPLNKLDDNSNDGCITNNCIGTYIHGILDNAAFVDYLLKPHLAGKTTEAFDYFKFKEEQFDKLADHVRSHVNMELIYSFIK